MHFDGLCRHLGTVDPAPVAAAINALGEDAWAEFESRQRQFDIHRDTETIPLLFDKDGRHTNPSAWPRFDQLKPALQPALDLIQGSYPSGTGGNGYFIRILLTRLAPGGTIPRHRDDGPSLLRSHRHHLAIATNRLVDFFVGGKQHHFAAGEIWEINNRTHHAVRNLSADPRVHVIMDYVVPGERVEDPDGTVYA